MEEGRQIVRQLLQQLRQLSGYSPLDYLKDAIESQQDAIILNRILSRLPTSDNHHQTLAASVLKAQNGVVSTAKMFVPAVLKWQEKQFNKTPKTDSESRCQEHPWDEALPLYYQGESAAAEALNGLALQKQEEALNKWRQVAKTMQKPLEAFKGSCRGKREKREEQKKKESAKEEKKTEQQPSSMDQILRQLLEMNQEDTLPRGTPVIQTGGIKPW